jgi:hypothetical protein
LVAWAATARAEDPPIVPTPQYEQQTGAVDAAVQAIGAKVAEINALRTKASKDATPGRLACIDEKLNRLRTSHTSAKTIQSGWALAKDNPAYALRSLDRLSILKLFSTAIADEAYACTDSDAPQTTTVKVETSTPELPPTLTPDTQPTIDRPPLASPY